jgi:hypothetical protein
VLWRELILIFWIIGRFNEISIKLLGFDLITLEKTDIHDVEKMINKKPPLTSWDKVQLTKKDDDTDN